MVKFYFRKFLITSVFIAFLLGSIICFAADIVAIINHSIVLPEILTLPIPIIGMLSYWKYLKAVYNNTPALIINLDSIYIFEINQTISWKDIQSYKFGRYIYGQIISINFKLFEPKEFISSIENTTIRSIYQLRYFLFRRIIIKVQVHLLKDYPEFIVKTIDDITNKSQL